MTEEQKATHRALNRKAMATVRAAKKREALIRGGFCLHCRMLLITQYHQDWPCDGYKEELKGGVLGADGSPKAV